MPLNRREQRFVAAGGLVAVLGLGYLLWPSSAPTANNVELVPADQRTKAGPVPVPPPATTPAVPTPPPAVPVATSGVVPEGVRLTGIMGRGATFSLPDGSQRYVPVGSELAPGLLLQSVRVSQAVLTAGSQTWTMGFGGGATAVAPSGAPAPAAPAASAGELANRAQTQVFERALEPHQSNGRIVGFTLRAGHTVPALQQAGLQPGDRILSVNGSELTPSSLQELAWTISNSARTEFEIERGGRRMSVAIEGRR